MSSLAVPGCLKGPTAPEMMDNFSFVCVYAFLWKEAVVFLRVNLEGMELVKPGFRIHVPPSIPPPVPCIVKRRATSLSDQAADKEKGALLSRTFMPTY